MALLESSPLSDSMVNWISVVIASIFGADDIIDEGERKELKELSERLNLTDEDIKAIETHLKNKKK